MCESEVIVRISAPEGGMVEMRMCLRMVFTVPSDCLS